MSEKNDDGFWAEIRDAVTPRRSPAAWAAQRARIVSRLTEPRPMVRAWVAVPALAALAGGLFLFRGSVLDKFLPPETSVRRMDWNARLTTVDGLVTVIPKGETEAVQAVAGMPINAGDRILTDAEGRAELALSAESLIELGPAAALTVANLEQLHTFIDLDLGSIVAKFHWDKSIGRRLEIRTPTAVAAVRGTEFGVDVASDGETSVGVFDEGRVAVRAKEDPSVQETMLEPMQEVSVPSGAAPSTEERQGQSFLKISELSRLQPLHERVERMRGREQELVRSWRDVPGAERERAREGIRREQGERLARLPAAVREASRARLNQPVPRSPFSQMPRHLQIKVPAERQTQASPKPGAREKVQPRQYTPPQRREERGPQEGMRKQPPEHGPTRQEPRGPAEGGRKEPNKKGPQRRERPTHPGDGPGGPGRQGNEQPGPDRRR